MADKEKQLRDKFQKVFDFVAEKINDHCDFCEETLDRIQDWYKVPVRPSNLDETKNALALVVDRVEFLAFRMADLEASVCGSVGDCVINPINTDVGPVPDSDNRLVLLKYKLESILSTILDRIQAPIVSINAALERIQMRLGMKSKPQAAPQEGQRLLVVIHMLEAVDGALQRLEVFSLTRERRLPAALTSDLVNLSKIYKLDMCDRYEYYDRRTQIIEKIKSLSG